MIFPYAKHLKLYDYVKLVGIALNINETTILMHIIQKTYPEFDKNMFKTYSCPREKFLSANFSGRRV